MKRVIQEGADTVTISLLFSIDLLKIILMLFFHNHLVLMFNLFELYLFTLYISFGVT